MPSLGGRTSRSWRTRARGVTALAMLGLVSAMSVPHVASAAPAAPAAPEAPSEPGAQSGTQPTASASPTPTAAPTATSPANPAQPQPVQPANPAPGQAPAPAPAAPQAPQAPKAPAAPTWAEVGAALTNEYAKQALTEAISKRIADLEASIAAAKAESAKAGAGFDAAKTKADDRRSERMQLDARIAAATKAAEASIAAVGKVAMNMRHNTGGMRTSVVTFFRQTPDEDFLYKWTTLHRLSDNENQLLERANRDRAQLDALRAQSQKALDEAVRFEAEAAAKRDGAVAAQTRLEAQECSAKSARAQLDPMLQALTSGQTPTKEEIDAAAAKQSEECHASVANLTVGSLSSQGVSASLTGAYPPMLGATVTDGFGMRLHPVEHTLKMHWGTDYVATNGNTCGAPLYAALGGRVVYAGPFGTFGNLVEIDAGNGLIMRYAHIVDGGIGVKVGQQVSAGQPIALAGSTGYSTGCHLHFEVEAHGTRLDSHAWLKSLGVGS